MTAIENIADAAEALRGVIQRASAGLIDRESLIELVVLGAVAGEHLLVVGPPGTGKSAAVRATAAQLGSSYFEYLVGRFTEPNEIFGPVDLRKLRDGIVETQTAGMLPEAEVAFLDEVFLGSTAILNTLLTLLNERTFARGHTRVRTPLRICIGASNALPDDDSLSAFADRFLLRCFVEPISDTRLEDMLDVPRTVTPAVADASNLAALDLLTNVASRADLSGARDAIAHAVRTLRSAGINLTDRRIVRVRGLVAAAAALDGRTTPDERDLWPLLYAIPTREQQAAARDLLREPLTRSTSRTLLASAEDAALGTLAKVPRLEATVETLSSTESAARDHAWARKLEAWAREIDATFQANALPAKLAEMRKWATGVLDAAA